MSIVSQPPDALNPDRRPPDRNFRSIRIDPEPDLPSAGIVIGNENEEVRFDPRTIANAGRVAAITQRCQESTSAVFDVNQVLSFPEPFFTDTVRFLFGLQQSAPQRLIFAGETSNRRHNDLFDAALHLLCGHGDPNRCSKAIGLAIRVAAVEHPDALPAACSQIRERLQHLGVQGYSTRELITLGQEIVRAGFLPTSERAQHDIVLVADALDDREVPDYLAVPRGWTIGANGISRLGADAPGVVASAPIIIRKRLIDIEGNAEFLEVAWRRDGQWKTTVSNRREMSDRRELLKLAEFGAPLHSNNAAGCVQYLADFEAANLEALPVEHLARTMGWHLVDGHQVFLSGRTILTANSVIAGDDSSQEGPRPLVFRGADVGDDQLVDGFRQEGSFEGWREAISALHRFQRAQLTLYSALAAPLLFVLRAANFIVSLAAPTSLGKTTCLRVAASVWGCPDESSRAAAMSTWDATRVWIERALAILRAIPLVIDDTKLARRPQDVAQTIYDVASGRGRSRGSLLGMLGSGTWRTIMITSGETPVTSFKQDGGTRARVVELWGSPFGETSEETGRLVTNLTHSLAANYGHAGPRFVNWLLRHQLRWPQWRQQFEGLRDEFQALAGRNAVAGRMGIHCAAIEMAALLSHEAGIIPWEYQSIVAPIWPELIRETEDADRGAAALRYVAAWAHSHRNEFIDERDINCTPPSNGWLGRWMCTNSQPAAACLGIIPPICDTVLRDADFEPISIRRTWNDRHWLRTNSDRTTLKVRFGRGRSPSPSTEVVAILWSTINIIVGAADCDEGANRLPSGPTFTSLP